MSGSEPRPVASWISFGPDREPFAFESRRLAEEPAPRGDGLLVAGDPEEVVRALAQAGADGSGWCRLEALEGDAAQPVFVQAQHVRFVRAVAD